MPHEIKGSTWDIESSVRFTHDGGVELVCILSGHEYTFEFVLSRVSACMLRDQLDALLKLPYPGSDER